MKQFVIFNVGDYSFGVDILEIVEIIKPTKIVKLPSAPQYVEGIIDVRGTSVPVYNLAKRLEIESKAETQKIIIVQLSKFQLGFWWTMSLRYSKLKMTRLRRQTRA